MEDNVVEKAAGGRRIMRQFRLQELSAVDRPAQMHAKMTLMKRDDGDPNANPKGDVMEKNDQVSVEDLQKKLDEEVTKAAALTAELEAAKAELVTEKAKPDKDEEDFIATVKDEEKTKKFLALSKDERKKVMEEAKKNDEVLTIEGVEIRKSVVGTAQFAVMKSQHDRLTKQERDLAVERDLRKRAELAKVVADEYDNLPGETEKKVDVLAAIGKLDEDVTKTLATMLAAGNKAISAAFDTVGHKGEAKKSAGDFMKRVNEIRVEDKCSNQEAMQKARQLHPDLFAAYQDSN